jgi:hypothetical protein
MGIQTICLARDINKPILPWEYRQWPGQWPMGNSIVGNSLFIPPVNGEFVGDWLICLTPPPPSLRTTIPRERRIFFMLETPDFWNPDKEFLDQFGCIVSPYKLENFSGIQVNTVTTGLFWWYGMNMDGHNPGKFFLKYDDIRSENYPDKYKILSTITSSKSFLPGHKKRLDLVYSVKEFFGEQMDLFGHGINPISDKRDGLIPYKYHLAVENSLYPHYWTEKLSDPLLARCVVFYSGALEIDKYFSNKSVIPIDINDIDRTIKIINNVIKENSNPIREIEESRIKILDDFNFPFYCDQLIHFLLGQN